MMLRKNKKLFLSFFWNRTLEDLTAEVPTSNMANTKFYWLFSPYGACKLSSTDIRFSSVACVDQGQLGLRILIPQNISKTKKLQNFIFFQLKIFNDVEKK